jgi:branched-chain amino acid transport system ATP-binding protein
LELAAKVAVRDERLLVVRDVEMHFGGVRALRGASLDIAEGQICGLIGPNGAGKTTLFNCISGLYRPQSGEIRYGGQSLLGKRTHEIVHLGIARTFQNLGLYPGLTVLENVQLGGQAVDSQGFFGPVARYRANRAREGALRDAALAHLDRLGLSNIAHRVAAGLPFGTLKRIELARALMSRPKLLMLDEPAGGLTHGEVDELAQLIRALRDEFSMTVLLVEHHMKMVMTYCRQVVVLNLGTTLASGTPAEVQANPEVAAAYLSGAK